MKNPHVMDCSQVMAFLLGEAEGARMEALLRGAVRRDLSLVAPALLAYEVNNVLTIAHRKHRITDRDRLGILDDFFQLPITTDPFGGKAIHHQAGELAKQHQLTAYDAAYLELALRLDAKLFTLDQDLLRLSFCFPGIIF